MTRFVVLVVYVLLLGFACLGQGELQTSGGLMPALQVITPMNAARLELLRVLDIPNYRRGAVSQCETSFSPDGLALVSACGRSRGTVFDVQSGAVLFELYDMDTQLVACAFSPDGTRIACGGFDNAITIFDATSGEELVRLGQHSSPVWDISFSPDGTRLVSCSLRHDVRLWDLRANAMVWSFSAGSGLLSVSFASSGDSVAYGSLRQQVGILDVGTGEETAHLSEPKRHVGDISYGATGQFLVAGCDDNLAYQWNAADHTLLGSFSGHDGYVNGVALSPDESILVTGSHDKKVGVWSTANQTAIVMLEGHEDTVLRVSMNPEGTLIASVSWDGTVRLWGVPRD